MKIKFLNGLKRGATIELSPLGLSIGRETDNDVHLLVEGVSRYHAKIEQIGQNWIVKDLGSTNGVEINKHTIPTSQVLSEGDTISIGDQDILFGEEKKAQFNLTPEPLPEEPTPTQETIPKIEPEKPSNNDLDSLKIFDNEKTAENEDNTKKSGAARKFILNLIFYFGVLFIAAIAILVFLQENES